MSIFRLNWGFVCLSGASCMRFTAAAERMSQHNSPLCCHVWVRFRRKDFVGEGPFRVYHSTIFPPILSLMCEDAWNKQIETGHSFAGRERFLEFGSYGPGETAFICTALSVSAKSYSPPKILCTYFSYAGITYSSRAAYIRSTVILRAKRVRQMSFS